MKCALSLLILVVGSVPIASGQDLPTLRVEGARDVTNEGLAFVEVTAERTVVFDQEPVSVMLRIGVEIGFLDEQVIQLFRRRLDVPAQVQVSWLEVGGTRSEGRTSRNPSFALNGTVAEAHRVAEEVRDGRTYLVLELDGTCRVTGAGERVLARPILLFAYATRFQADFFEDRVPQDRLDALVRGESLALRVRELPEEGRPPDFSGAVGRFSVRAEVEAAELAVGESLTLVLHVEGEGNLASAIPPRLDRLEGFHLLGTLTDATESRLTASYDLAPTGPEVVRVPAIGFSFFDPGIDPGTPAAYRTEETRPIPIVVHSREDDSQAADDEGALPWSEAREGESRGAGILIALLGGTVVVLGLVAIGLRAHLRGVERRNRAIVRAAVSAFRRRAEEADGDLTEAFTAFLATLLHCMAPAVITADLPDRLATAGLTEELAARAAGLLDDLGAARYGGQTPAGSAEAARGLVDEVEASLLKR